MSAGFGESGDDEARADGPRRSAHLVAAARAHGMRVVGPNCLGVVNTDPRCALNASLRTGRAAARPGRLLLPVRGAGRRGAGRGGAARARASRPSSRPATGPTCRGNDLLQYWESDPATELALLYLESFGNPRKFARIARRFARRKPIVAVKSGRRLDGRRAAAHLGGGARSQRAGAVRGVRHHPYENLAELFDVALLLTTQPLPSGNRVAVVGHSTALGVLVVDALATSGPAPGPVGRRRGGRQRRGVRVGMCGPNWPAPDVDAVISIFVPPMRRGEEAEVAAQLRQAVAAQPKPVLSTFLGFDGVPAELAVAGPLAPTPGSIPSYSSPERAVGALARVCRYAQWRQREPGRLPELAGVRTEAGAGVHRRSAGRNPCRTPPDAGREPAFCSVGTAYR